MSTFVRQEEHQAALDELAKQTRELREARLLLQDITRNHILIEQLREAPTLVAQILAAGTESLRAHREAITDFRQQAEQFPAAVEQQHEIIRTLASHAARIGKAQALIVEAQQAGGALVFPDPPAGDPSLTASSDQIPPSVIARNAATKTQAYNVQSSDQAVFADVSNGAFPFTLEDATAVRGFVHRIGIAPASVLDTPNVLSVLTQPGQTIGDYNLPAPTIGALTATGGGGQLDAGTYFYVVTAVNDIGETLASSEASALVSGSRLGIPVISSLTPATAGGHLPDTTTFTYWVTAINAAGETVPSAPMSVTTGSGGGLNQVTVAWGAVAGATGYNVYRNQGNALSMQKFAAGNVTSFVDGTAWVSGNAGTYPDIDSTGASITVNYTLPPGARAAKIYRGTASGAENTAYFSYSLTSFLDQGLTSSAGTQTVSRAPPPVINGTLLTVGTPYSGAPYSDVELVSDGANWRPL